MNTQRVLAPNRSSPGGRLAIVLGKRSPVHGGPAIVGHGHRPWLRLPETWAGYASAQYGVPGLFFQVPDNEQNLGDTMPTRIRRKGREPDPRQPDFLSLLEPGAELIAAPQAPVEAGQIDHDAETRALLNEAIKRSPFDRDQIADRMTPLAGRKITKEQLDSWTGASRPNRFPAELIGPFNAAVGNTILLDGLAELSGCKLIEGLELQFARLGQLLVFIEHAKAEQARIIADLPIFRSAGHA